MAPRDSRSMPATTITASNTSRTSIGLNDLSARFRGDVDTSVTRSPSATCGTVGRCRAVGGACPRPRCLSTGSDLVSIETMTASQLCEAGCDEDQAQAAIEDEWEDVGQELRLEHRARGNGQPEQEVGRHHAMVRPGRRRSREFYRRVIVCAHRTSHSPTVLAAERSRHLAPPLHLVQPRSSTLRRSPQRIDPQDHGNGDDRERYERRPAHLAQRESRQNDGGQGDYRRPLSRHLAPGSTRRRVFTRDSSVRSRALPHRIRLCADWFRLREIRSVGADVAVEDLFLPCLTPWTRL